MGTLLGTWILLTHGRYDHPYRDEIEKLSFPDAVRQDVEPIPSRSFQEDVVYVSSIEGVKEMLAELKQASEIAVDLEHHDTYSYIGIVCLMQISTRNRDWIVDTLLPWREELQMLNEVFADPKIVKVFHGSHSDVIWLQRDLGLYLVGLFDTFHASNALNFPERSLKYLLLRFCDFHANKKLQTADWRQRPLPQDMLDYARSDTHFLLFIYDNLRNMLLEESLPNNDLIDSVLQNSKQEALQKYERPIYDVENGLGSVGWCLPLARRSVFFTPEQLSVFRAVHQWRDNMARKDDESVTLVLNNASLFRVAEKMPLSLTALTSATKPVSRAVSVSFDELLAIIKEAKATGQNGPTLEAVMNANRDRLPPRWSQWKRPQPSQRDLGLGTTLKMLNENGGVESTVERSSFSQFWGNIAHRAKAIPAELAESLQETLRILLPLPTLTGGSQHASGDEIAVDALHDQPATTHNPMDQATASQPGETKVVEVNGSNKRTAESAGLENVDDLAENSVPSDQSTPAYRQSRKRKNKGDRQANNTPKSVEAGSEPAIEPFDYAGAESVLHPTSDQTRKTKSGDKNKSQFNPYNKAVDAPMGQKRQRKEIAGRSFTFKK